MRTAHGHRRGGREPDVDVIMTRPTAPGTVCPTTLRRGQRRVGPLVALLMTLAAAGCSGGSLPGSPTDSSTSSALDHSVLPVTPSTDSADRSLGADASPSAVPNPQMTRIDEPVCTTTRSDDPATGPLRLEGLWAADPSPSAPWSEVITVTRGKGAESCAGELPPDAYCDQVTPWTGLSIDALVHATGAQTYITADVPGPDPRARADRRDPDVSPRSMTYSLMTASSGRPLTIASALRVGAVKCAGARVSTMPGGAVLEGGLRDYTAIPYGKPAPYMTFLAVILADGAAWASLQGSRWSQSDIDRATNALRRALDASCDICAATEGR